MYNYAYVIFIPCHILCTVLFVTNPVTNIQFAYVSGHILKSLIARILQQLKRSEGVDKAKQVTLPRQKTVALRHLAFISCSLTSCGPVLTMTKYMIYNKLWWWVVTFHGTCPASIVPTWVRWINNRKYYSAIHQMMQQRLGILKGNLRSLCKNLIKSQQMIIC